MDTTIKHVTMDDVMTARDEERAARDEYEAAKAAAADRLMELRRVKSSILERCPERPEYAAWEEAEVRSDACRADLDRAARVSSAMTRQRVYYLAREVSLAVMAACGKLDGKPCRYKRVKDAVSKACEGIDASVYLDDQGVLHVEIPGGPYGSGVSLYPTSYELGAGEWVFHPGELARYIGKHDGIDGMLSGILDAGGVRAMMGDLDGKLASVREDLRAAHAAAKELETAYRVLGMSGYIDDECKRACI